jgi:hypothetical protein
MSGRPRKDASVEREQLLAFIRGVAERCGRVPTVSDYNDGRRELAAAGGDGWVPPSMSAVYRMFGKWPQALAATGIVQPDTTASTRASDEELIHDLRHVAAALGSEQISTQLYDRYRRTHPEPIVCAITGKTRQLFSSSVIRKWLGDWPEAVGRAGLATTGRITEKRVDQEQRLLTWIRRAHEDGYTIDGPGWSRFWHDLDQQEQQEAPTAAEIERQFGSWAEARHQAQVDPGSRPDEMLDPVGKWLRSDVEVLLRRLLETVYGVANTYERPEARAVLERGLSQDQYERLFVAKTDRPMPPWSAVAKVYGLPGGTAQPFPADAVA